MKYPTATYRVGDCRESITGIGVVWPVVRVYGRCGCGSEEMFTHVAFFVDKADAVAWANSKTKKEPIHA